MSVSTPPPARQKRMAREGDAADAGRRSFRQRVRSRSETEPGLIEVELELSAQRRLQVAARISRRRMSAPEKLQRIQDFHQYENERLAQVHRRLHRDDFDFLAAIGQGAFGHIHMVREKTSRELFALKCLDKATTVAKDKVLHVLGERNCLAEADNPWLVKLFYAFQDSTAVYFAMELVPGGDLMQLLMREQKLPEKAARFYFCETACAIQAIHDMGYVHRDLKPDNILLDHRGHIKLADMGLARRIGEPPAAPSSSAHARGSTVRRPYPAPPSPAAEVLRELSESSEPLAFEERTAQGHKPRHLLYSNVGTLDYKAPEVVLEQTGYGTECDWWSLGAVLYECLVGYAPFADDTEEKTMRRIVRCMCSLPASMRGELSMDCVAVLRGLLRPGRNRLGSRGLSEVQQVAWLSDVNFADLLETDAPYLPSHAETIHANLARLAELDMERDAEEIRIITDELLHNFDVPEKGNADTVLDLTSPHCGPIHPPHRDWSGFSFKRDRKDMEAQFLELATEGDSVVSLSDFPCDDLDDDLGLDAFPRMVVRDEGRLSRVSERTSEATTADRDSFLSWTGSLHGLG